MYEQFSSSIVTGMFAGRDTNADGHLSLNELTSFHLDYTGFNANEIFIPAFSMDLEDLEVFGYDLPSSGYPLPLGDNPDEGIYGEHGPFIYAVCPMPPYPPCSWGGSAAGIKIPYTDQGFLVGNDVSIARLHAVPEPPGAWWLGLGLVVIGALTWQVRLRTNRTSKKALKGDRKGQYSIRINNQWHICFQWKQGDALDVENRRLPLTIERTP
jgi:hypothetical protein